MQKNLEWIDPLELANTVASQSEKIGSASWVFLYSGLHQQINNSFSYLALFPKNEIIADNLAAAEAQIESTLPYFGYINYEAGAELEVKTATRKIPQAYRIDLPKIWLINFSLVFIFDHERKKLTVRFENESELDIILSSPRKRGSSSCERSSWIPAFAGMTERGAGMAKVVRSNFSDQSYLAAIKEIKRRIADGEFYQTNLTRKFYGTTQSKNYAESDYFTLFADLAAQSPANYSAFFALRKNYIISSSPELFFALDKSSRVESHPIKGTKARSIDPKQDEENRRELKASAKEKGENLMIVDLVRNDLAKVCKVGSVKVEELFKLTSYQTVHHLSSVISAQLKQNCSIVDLLKATFPPGSMTGMPKIKAMEVATEFEKIPRGVYSGCLGYINLAGASKLSVVIRTIICAENKFEFQAGGAITFDSDPKQELAEMYVKLSAIAQLLNINFK